MSRTWIGSNQKRLRIDNMMTASHFEEENELLALLWTMFMCDVSRLSAVRCLANASIHYAPQILLLLSLINFIASDRA
jgi:hypothetical protein